MTTGSPRKRSILPFFTGTRPGLESLLFATVPALVAGSLGYFWLGGWAGLGIGLATLLVVARLARGIADVPDGDGRGGDEGGGGGGGAR